MKKLTYQEAYNKIIDAYFKDEIRPFNADFCFCGTLCGGGNWAQYFEPKKLPYTMKELSRMEHALYKGLVPTGIVIESEPSANSTNNAHGWVQSHLSPKFEDCLFDGMVNALEVLKQIHKERGEDVDSVPEFTKRKLQPQP